jgi:YHS domain-containing protein
MLVRLLEFLLDALVLFFVIRLVTRLFLSGGASASRPAAPPPERSGGTLVRDPECGTFIPESRAIQMRTGGTVLFFCSTACRDAYAARSQPPAKQPARS